MSQFEQEDNLGNPWLAILIGGACLLLAWYLYSKIGSNPHLIGKAAAANSGIGRKLLVGLFSLIGAYFMFRGIGKLRAGK
jgi:hypothetical protein